MIIAAVTVIVYSSIVVHLPVHVSSNSFGKEKNTAVCKCNQTTSSAHQRRLPSTTASIREKGFAHIRSRSCLVLVLVCCVLYTSVLQLHLQPKPSSPLGDWAAHTHTARPAEIRPVKNMHGNIYIYIPACSSNIYPNTFFFFLYKSFIYFFYIRMRICRL